MPQVKDSQGAILVENTHYTVVAGVFKDEACTQAVANLKDLKADGTKYYRKVEGKDTYVGKSKTAWFTVNKKTLNITVNTNFERNYNTETEPTIEANAWDGTGFVNNASSTGGWTDTKAVLTGTLQYTYAGKGNKTYPGGVYPITFSGLSSDNYDIKYPTKNFTIVGTNLTSETVTVKQGTAFADKTYKGDFYTAADLTGLKLVWGEKELVQGTDFDVVLKAVYSFTSYSAQTNGTQYGTGTVNVLSKDASDNSAIVEVLTNSVDGFVGKKYKVALTANGTTRTQLMGDGTGNDYTTASGIWVTVVRSNDIAMNVGLYNYDVVFKGNYSGKKTSIGTVKIVAAPITVSLKKTIEKTYSNTDYKDVDLFSDASLDFSGICGEDMANAATIKAAFLTASTGNSAFTVKCKTTAIEANNYVLTIAGGAVGSYTNYEIKNYLPGTLKINKAKLALKAKDAQKGIDDEDPEFELDPSYYTAPATGATAPAGYKDPIVDGDRITGVTFSRDGGQAAGKYDITPVANNAKVERYVSRTWTDVTKNYEFVIVENNSNVTPATKKGQLTIGKSAIYVNIQNVEKFYGQDDPEFTAIITGLTGGDEIPATAYTITRTAGEAPGFYEMTTEVANPNTDKYSSITVVPGIFTIKKAQLTFTIPAQNVVTGDKKDKLKKDDIKVAGIYKSGDVAANMYDLAFNNDATDGVALEGTNNDQIKNENKTYAKGILATLKAAYRANYEVIGDNQAASDGATPTYYGATGKLIVNEGTAVALTLTSENASLATIKEHAGEVQTVTIDFAKRNRKINATADVHTWAADNWNALILPFDITVAELSNKLGYAANGDYNYAVVNTIKKNSATGKFQFELATGKIPANTPFMVKTIGAITTTDATATTITGKIKFGSKKIVAPEAEKVEIVLDNGYKFVGQYKDFVLDKNMPMNAKNEGLYRFQYGDDDAQFRTFGSSSANSWTIVPFDCYVDLSADASGREVIFEFQEADGSTTAIKSLAADIVNVTAKAQGWYTINGVKLQSAPTQKGIYIFNGKKLVVK